MLKKAFTVAVQLCNYEFASTAFCRLHMAWRVTVDRPIGRAVDRLTGAAQNLRLPTPFKSQLAIIK